MFIPLVRNMRELSAIPGMAYTLKKKKYVPTTFESYAESSNSKKATDIPWELTITVPYHR